MSVCTGTLPDSWQAWNLSMLDVGSNPLVSTLPASWGSGAWASAILLGLSNTSL